ncbi:thioesterase family protein [Phenylobacterium sp.]|uniref:acyl-CoA thioesterase n=1 Tax=Phenylobacterium sp. TaxID=1871053 RepID=UPI0025D966D8|nr:acyl-CoA thioesterase [Phenylobacterium sp.]MBX3485435.1 acyl-CoA thioesterase [Phenylobacterium sp.]MCW5760335.1 acyl-CoA thioesterase [Phenylobacterium sp.]
MTKLLEPPEGRQVFRLTFEPQPSDIDENGHVNNVVYLRWAQDMGVAHWQSLAPADARAAWVWVALRHEIDYRRELKLGETAQGRTWVAEAANGARFDRMIRIDGPDGAMCAQVVTTWVLVEQSTRRPRRVPGWITAMFA